MISRRVSGLCCALALALAVVVAPQGLGAQTVEDKVKTLEAQLAAMQEELRALQAEQEAAAAPGSAVAAPAPSEAPAAASPADAGRLAELERRLEVLAAELERLDVGEAAATADRAERGLGPAASKIYRTERGISIGGYGEMLYERFDDERDDGAGSGRTDQADFLRAIVYFGYKFSDKWLLNTEFEWEHGSTSRGGEASIEFAYLDYLARPELNARAGMVLLPMGLVNELHEPTLYNTARRPGVETVIIPSTWRENGLGLYGDVGPFTYRTYVVNGLDGSKFSAGGLRGGRQKGGFAKAEDFAWTGRLDYTGLPGLLAGVSAYAGDSGQGLQTAGRAVDLSTRIVDVHLDWRWRGFEVRSLFAQADLDDVADLNRALNLTGTASVGERLTGGYVEVAYDLFSLLGRGEGSLSPYVRLERYDTQDRVPAGWRRNPANDVEQLTLGVNWQPIDPLIFKLDWQDIDNGAGTGVDQINVALGYIF